MNPLRIFGQTTPFIPPSLDVFEKKAPRSTFFGRLPYLSFFENWFKYPFLVSSRFLVSLVVSITLAWLTVSPAYQNFAQEQLIDRYLPEIELEIKQDANTGNWLDDFLNNTTNTVTNAQQAGERKIVRTIAYETLAGEVFLLLRWVIIYLIYSALFWLLGTDIGSLEKLALQNQANLGNLSKVILNKIQAQADFLYSRQAIHPNDYQNIQALSQKALKHRQPLTDSELDYLLNFLAQTHRPGN